MNDLFNFEWRLGKKDNVLLAIMKGRAAFKEHRDSFLDSHGGFVHVSMDEIQRLGYYYSIYYSRSISLCYEINRASIEQTS